MAENKEKATSVETPADKTKADSSSEASAKEEASKLSKGSEEMISKIEKMTVLELNELVKALEEKFGVSAQAPMAFAGPATGNADANAEPAEEKTSFDVILTAMGENKLSVIKAVRELKPDLGLKDAKDLVESAPKPVLEGVKKEEADAAKAKLESAGGKVELK